MFTGCRNDFISRKVEGDYFAPANLQMTTRMNNDCGAQVYTHVVVVLLLNALFLLFCLGLHLLQLQTVEKVIFSGTIINIIIHHDEQPRKEDAREYDLPSTTKTGCDIISPGGLRGPGFPLFWLSPGEPLSFKSTSNI